MDLRTLVPPLVGAIIGYITNDIAIKMLFHPRRPIYIGKWKLPFTPGLIPKEKHRVAQSVGNVVSNQLLNPDTLVSAMTSNEMVSKLRCSMENIINRNRDNKETVKQFLLRVVPEEMLNNSISDIKVNIAVLLYSRLVEMHFGQYISKYVLQKINLKISEMTRSILAGFFDEALMNSIAVSIGDMIDKAISDNAQEIVETVLDNETDKLMDLKICDLITQYEDKIPVAMDFIVSTYIKVVENNLPQILSGIDLGKIVKDKINSFDIIQLEQMIFGIMKKELKAIVNLGALLGFIMGWINLFISL